MTLSPRRQARASWLGALCHSRLDTEEIEGSRDSSQPAGDAHRGLCEGNDGAFRWRPTTPRAQPVRIAGGVAQNAGLGLAIAVKVVS